MANPWRAPYVWNFPERSIILPAAATLGGKLMRVGPTQAIAPTQAIDLTIEHRIKSIV
jgi:hypothetical protein